jgi:hypothetical protein
MKKEANPMYKPSPINVSKISLSPVLIKLIEKLARNTHEIWAQKRIDNGWTFGSLRDDVKKQHPCLVPFEELPESEKEYDRVVVENILKAVIALGYVIE